MAADAVEGEREHARADQDEDHERGQFGGGFGGLADQVPAQPALEGAEDERAGWRPWRRLRSGWRRPMKIVPSTRKIRNSRRHHDERGLLRHRGEETEAGEFVEDPVQHGDEECEQDAEEHAEHNEVHQQVYSSSS